MRASTGDRRDEGADVAARGPTTRELLARHRASAVIVALIAVAYLAFALVWGAKAGPDEGPDEPEHMGEVAFIADNGRLPILGVDLCAHFMDESTRTIFDAPPIEPTSGMRPFQPPPGVKIGVRPYYAAMPGMNYVVAAGFVAVGRVVGVADARAAARCSSAVFGAIAVFVLGLLAIRLRPQRRELHVLVPAAVACLPQFVFIGAYVNSDAYAAMFAAVVWWRLLVAAKAGWTTRRAVILGLCLGLGLLGKLTAYPALAVAAASVPVLVPGSVRRRIGIASLVGASALVIAAPWYVHNISHYGDPLGQTTTLESTRKLVDELPPETRAALRTHHGTARGADMGASYLSMLAGRWGESTRASFVGKFGYMTKPLMPWQYRLGYGLGLFGLAGFAWGCIRAARMRVPVSDAAFIGAAALAVPVQLAFSLRHSMATDWQPQGRYLFPALTGVALVLAFGWTAFFHGARARMLVAGAVVAAAVVLVATAYALVFV